ncbi:antiterminator Q family protein [Rodentibacter haemolyticus]|uniref:Antitermination protein n=1 Tax=Rodentibacter haemolyticus TaxID=2778911 RepID=A0ABX6UVV0_9PAST|nr:antiterminator Q family protein [Rodentibacter haemolyticus]QPB42203.1 antitermination protein [Rodentibacter haemolyticus]
MNYSVERILEKWGSCWGRARIGTEYPFITPSIPVLPLKPRKAWLKHLSDEECLKIESAIMALHSVDLLAYQVTMAMYVQDMGEKDITTALNISRATMYRCRGRGVRFLQGAFSILDVKYHYIG